MSRLQRVWNAVRNVTVVISLVVNIVLISLVLILASQIGAIKATLSSVVGQLDAAFVALGDAVVEDNIHIDQRVPVSFALPIDQRIQVVTTDAVPLSLPASFSLGSFGQINGTVSLALPRDLPLPIHIVMNVPVNSEIPVVFDQQVSIPLGARGLAPVIRQLRSVTQPLMQTIQALPNAIP